MTEPLEVLIQTARACIDALREEGKLRLEPRMIYRMRISGFRYDERGPHFDRAAEHVSTVMGSWEAAPAAVRGMLPEIRAAARMIDPVQPHSPQTEFAVEKLCHRIVWNILEGREPDALSVRQRYEATVRNLRGEAVRTVVEADLTGVVVLDTSVEFTSGERLVRLRGIRQDDLEQEYPIELAPLAKSRLPPGASSIIQIEYAAANGAGWQPELEKTVTLLRLFDTGGVTWKRMSNQSDSELDISAGTLLCDDQTVSFRSYVIRPADAERLLHFWDVMSPLLPEHFYWNQPEDPEGLLAAFENYNRAVAIGWVDERVANVVRALESLFLRPQENKQIAKLLRQRIVTLLEPCGFDHSEVTRTITLAYEVRSRYVHGGAPLSKSDRRKVDALPDGLATLLLRCLDYLRVALVAAIAARTDKEALLHAIEEAEREPRRMREIGAAYKQAMMVAS